MNLSTNFYRKLNTQSDTLFDLVIPENATFLLNVTMGKLRQGWTLSTIKVCENIPLVIPDIPKAYSLAWSGLVIWKVWTLILIMNIYMS